MPIQKKIGYKAVPKIAYPEIDQLISDAFKTNAPENKKPAQANSDFKKWVMPEEPKGYLHGKTNDPL